MSITFFMSLSLEIQPGLKNNRILKQEQTNGLYKFLQDSKYIDEHLKKRSLTS